MDYIYHNLWLRQFFIFHFISFFFSLEFLSAYVKIDLKVFVIRGKVFMKTKVNVAISSFKICKKFIEDLTK